MKNGGNVLSFQEFFNMYPRAVNYGLAEAEWHKVNPTPTVQAEIVEALKWQRVAWTNVSEQFIPTPASYLMRQRWKDKPVGWFKRTVQKVIKHEVQEPDRAVVLESLYVDVEANPELYRKGAELLGSLKTRVFSPRVLKAIDGVALPANYNPPILDECPW